MPWSRNLYRLEFDISELSPDSYRYRGSFYEEPTTVKPVIMIYEVNMYS